MVSVAPTATRRDVPEDLVFTVAPLGMAGLRRFHLTALDDTGYLFALRSVDDPAVRLFVVPPGAYFPHYDPALDATVLESLGLRRADAVLLVVVRPGTDGEAPTANLLAPVVVDPTTGTAAQVVLDSDEWPLRARLGGASAA